MNFQIQRLSPGNNFFWIICAFLLKGTLILLFIENIAQGFEQISFGRTGYGFGSGDTPSYFDPIENFLKDGSYHPDYRMPGYGIIYLMLRSIVVEDQALKLIILIQLTIAALSIYSLSKLLYLVTAKNIVFYLTFFLFGLSLKTTFWDFAYLAESFAVSFLIFSSHAFILFWRSEKKKWLLLSGLFLTWVIFLKPVYLPVLFIFVAALLFFCFRIRKTTLKSMTLKVFVFAAPFILFDGLWIIRNYQRYDRLIPLTKTTYYPGYEESYLGPLMDFVIAFGGDRSWWNPKGELRWFISNPADGGGTPVPEEVYTSSFNGDSLVSVRKDIAIILNPGTSQQVMNELSSSVRARLNTYTESIRTEKPHIYYLTGRLKMVRKFLLHSGTDFLPFIPFRQMDLKQKFLKVLNGTLYVFSIAFGFLGIVYVILKKQAAMFAMALTGLYSTLIYPVLGQLEPRYYLPAYPFMLGCAIYFCSVYPWKARNYFD